MLRFETHGAALTALAITSALAFAAIDLWYGLSGRISSIYLADAVVELGLIALLILTRLKQADRT